MAHPWINLGHYQAYLLWRPSNCTDLQLKHDVMEQLIGLLVGLLEAGLALWFLIDLISNTCF